ncbi:FAD-binding oxidoreductase [Vallitalea okinawensis]|uniref:FAD-binding oxidoreductase n=1 Tax=Vallitalea okinawensis TaxID=2078660 RepID=UPI000CFB387D|nr:FAD-binding oxidoreductase [Vallitalea okinawensis]
MATFNIKTNRTFTLIRKYGFIFTLLVAIGGLWYPKLGLLVIPVMLGLILYSFYKGRYWCGNICAHGSLFDSLLMPISRNVKIPKFFKSKWLAIAFFIFFSYKLISKFIKVAGIYGSLAFFDKIGLIFVSSYLMVTILGGLLALIFAPRTWCNFCPMGVLQRLSYKLGKTVGVTQMTDEKITVTKAEMCHKCGKCSRVCPMQLEPYNEFSENNQFDSDICIKCSTCVENCPAGILTLATKKVAQVLNKHVSLEGYENRIRIKSKIVNIKKLKDDIIEYTFKFVDPQKVNYEAGQFILVKIQDNPEMFRAYSISSYDEDGTALSVTIKKMDDGYGTNMIFDNFKIGNEIELEGPMGHELIVNKDAKNVLLVAGGIGITPFIPIVTDLIRNDNNIKNIKLVYGANYKNEFIYVDEFKQLEEEGYQFEFIQVAAFDENWTGEKGFVTDYMKKVDLKDYQVYMCGPQPMIKASLKVLKELNIDEKDINYESA